MLFVLGQVLDDLVRHGRLSRNVASIVERPRHVPKESATWTAGEVRRIQQTASAAIWSLEQGTSGGARLEVDPTLRDAPVLVADWDDGTLITFTEGTGVRRWDV